MKRKSIIGALTAALAAGTILAGAPTAQAAARDGVCNPGEFCYYYNSYQKGSVSDFTSSVANLGDKQPSCYEFKGAGAGKRLCTKNNAASVWNRTNKPVTVFYNSNYGGASQTIAAGAKAQLNRTLKNNNASHRIGNPAAPKASTRLSYALYKAPGRLTCGFNGYTRTPGMHEGIDFARTLGAPVFALTPGVVTDVRVGADGGAISWIGIYDSRTDKTVFYVHAAPLGLKKGQPIKKGQQIAKESWRGISKKSSYHTHVEVRDGKKTSPAKSVRDYHLDNADPAPFWKAQGYTVG